MSILNRVKIDPLVLSKLSISMSVGVCVRVFRCWVQAETSTSKGEINLCIFFPTIGRTWRVFIRVLIAMIDVVVVVCIVFIEFLEKIIELSLSMCRWANEERREREGKSELKKNQGTERERKKNITLFQIGMLALSRSMRKETASNTSRRWDPATKIATDTSLMGTSLKRRKHNADDTHGREGRSLVNLSLSLHNGELQEIWDSSFKL